MYHTHILLVPFDSVRMSGNLFHCVRIHTHEHDIVLLTLVILGQVNLGPEALNIIGCSIVLHTSLKNDQPNTTQLRTDFTPLKWGSIGEAVPNVRCEVLL